MPEPRRSCGRCTAEQDSTSSVTASSCNEENAPSPPTTEQSRSFDRPTGTNQQWKLLPNADGSYRLVNVRSGKLLESPDSSTQGAALDQSTDDGGDNQWWKLVPSQAGGYYRLVNVRNGWCADVKDASTTDGVKVIQWPTTDGSNQDWQLIAL
ncbi:RICIN domain-containing protein [Streptomyces europaeiscabiei]|uniref:RICIN domain-containing protein n=1 Tax=Streptomyces europaeiscabiei TaxID=146819 RepID=UPI0029A2E099|nr:RICIN domain-containing protein [Streptomyces europaeiscabiei]MDX3693767.1 RICIN domain-containing protein [Streptomyces europaeiscabiei]